MYKVANIFKKDMGPSI